MAMSSDLKNALEGMKTSYKKKLDINTDLNSNTPEQPSRRVHALTPRKTTNPAVRDSMLVPPKGMATGSITSRNTNSKIGGGMGHSRR